ncbi:hypothetical protein HNP84_004570 [Thermocatellispora tengchongensis]|uniref:Uncharacterized protein n=1 Tax=Thermocatellispora tengchongensis TaxID=1073253 RepID=A0A840P898_9ACTN|nr:Rv3235 family protein [Thermocatellispora tengchongensis]MBB5134836.1 hypothetical protein [Thermocatellispora tengchongensis]
MPPAPRPSHTPPQPTTNPHPNLTPPQPTAHPHGNHNPPQPTADRHPSHNPPQSTTGPNPSLTAPPPTDPHPSQTPPRRADAPPIVTPPPATGTPLNLTPPPATGARPSHNPPPGDNAHPRLATSKAAASAGAHPSLAPPPPADPPYDDEGRRPAPTAPVAYVQGALALDAAPPPEPRRHLAAVPDEAGAAGPEIPGERRLRQLGQAFAEVLAGRRPPASVAAHVTDAAYRELVRTGTVIRADGPPFVAAPHVHMPGGDAIEMCLLVHCGDRHRVLAMRLELYGRRWLCTDFETTP